MALAASSHPDAATQLAQWMLILSDSPDALQRVIAVCRRRRAEIVGLDFRRDSSLSRLVITLRPKGDPGALRARLSGLIEVLMMADL